jgi:hypothetical protein
MIIEQIKQHQEVVNALMGEKVLVIENIGSVK